MYIIAGEKVSSFNLHLFAAHSKLCSHAHFNVCTLKWAWETVANDVGVFQEG